MGVPTDLRVAGRVPLKAILFVGVLLLQPEVVSAADYGTGFMAFLKKDGIFQADLEHGFETHYGSDAGLSEANKMGERQGCAIDHQTQILFYATPDDVSVSKWRVWAFTFLKDANLPQMPEVIAKIAVGTTTVLGIAVDQEKKDLYISYYGRGGVQVLKMENYDSKGQSLTRKSEFAPGVKAVQGEGGSIVIIGRKIYLAYSNDGTSAKSIAVNDLDSPSPGWSKLSDFEGVITGGFLGDMVYSKADAKLYVSSSDGSFPGVLHVVDPAGGAPQAFPGVVEDFLSVNGNRPMISAVGDKPGVLATTKGGRTLTESFLMTVADTSDRHKVAGAGPSTGPFGPICWSGAITPKTDAPPTPEPAASVAPDTPVPETPVPDTPAPPPGTTTAPETPAPPGTTTVPETPSPPGPPGVTTMPETIAPGATKAPDTPAPPVVSTSFPPVLPPPVPVPSVQSAAIPEEDSDNTVLIVIIICVTLLLCCIIGVGAWVYIQRNRERREVADAVARRDFEAKAHRESEQSKAEARLKELELKYPQPAEVPLKEVGPDSTIGSRKESMKSAVSHASPSQHSISQPPLSPRAKKESVLDITHSKDDGWHKVAAGTLSATQSSPPVNPAYAPIMMTSSSPRATAHSSGKFSLMASQNLSGKWNDDNDPSYSFRTASPRHSGNFGHASHDMWTGSSLTDLPKRRRIEMIYEVHAPEKLDRVDEMIDRYGEKPLLDALLKKYGEEPLDNMGQSQRLMSSHFEDTTALSTPLLPQTRTQTRGRGSPL
eukprot:TRINITY_DN1473_c0_g1_i4.p1 TRINITY_DN1473_c0_g1~~TRINITY_DN1473_c0_g1_i4.p1  ORF type:complete len:770 (+),score=215.43 TRINITY_DN1473_c0_g1_i4:385-2694(+)